MDALLCHVRLEYNTYQSVIVDLHNPIVLSESIAFHQLAEPSLFRSLYMSRQYARA
jgi:hypothetical protein